MAFHIVTSRCFIACEKVTSVVIEENIPERTRVRPKKTKAKKNKLGKLAAPVAEPPKQFTITVSYYPLAKQTNNQNGYGSSSSSTGIEECSIDLRVFGKKESYDLYREIVKEVRDQHPNEGYLDELVDKLLAGEPIQ